MPTEKKSKPDQEKQEETQPTAQSQVPTTEQLQETDESPDQSSEDRADVLRRAQNGQNTATGRERLRLAGQEERPDKKEQGSTQEIEGDPQPDFAKAKTGKLQGAQTQPANMAVNGTVPIGLVPSPSGPVPRDAIRASGVPEEAILSPRGAGVRLQANKRVPDDLIDRLDANSLRSIASDRGYNLPHGGVRTIRAKFRAEEQKRYDEKGEPRESPYILGAS